METSQSPGASSTKSSKRALVVIAIAIVVTILSYYLTAPANATMGYHLAAVIIKLVSYSIILFAISAGIAAAMGKFKTHALIIFGWLLLAAANSRFWRRRVPEILLNPKFAGLLNEWKGSGNHAPYRATC